MEKRIEMIVVIIIGLILLGLAFYLISKEPVVTFSIVALIAVIIKIDEKKEVKQPTSKI